MFTGTPYSIYKWVWPSLAGVRGRVRFKLKSWNGIRVDSSGCWWIYLATHYWIICGCLVLQTIPLLKIFNPWCEGGCVKRFHVVYISERQPSLHELIFVTELASSQNSKNNCINVVRTLDLSRKYMLGDCFYKKWKVKITLEIKNWGMC